MKANAFVLAAGLGTRLRPLTLVLPKPLVPVCGVPLLSYSLALCARHGLTDVLVNAHWFSEQLVRWEGTREGVSVHVSVEPAILGTGGGLKNVADRLADRFAVVNGDVVADVDLTALMRAVPEGGGAMSLRVHAEDARKYGVVAADDGHKVVLLKDIARADDVPGSVPMDTHFSGIHAMDRAMLDLVPDGFACVVRTAYKALVPVGRVAGLRHSGVWMDIGDPSSYLAANLALLDGAPAPLDPFERAERGDRARACWMGPGARVDGSVEHSVVGARAVVPAGASLRDCVVWNGIRVPPGCHERVVFFGTSEQMARIDVPADPHSAA